MGHKSALYDREKHLAIQEYLLVFMIKGFAFSGIAFWPMLVLLFMLEESQWIGIPISLCWGFGTSLIRTFSIYYDEQYKSLAIMRKCLKPFFKIGFAKLDGKLIGQYEAYTVMLKQGIEEDKQYSKRVKTVSITLPHLSLNNSNEIMQAFDQKYSNGITMNYYLRATHESFTFCYKDSPSFQQLTYRIEDMIQVLENLGYQQHK